MYKTTYSVEQLHRSDWTDEDRSETSKTSFNEYQVRTQETCKKQVLYRFVSHRRCCPPLQDICACMSLCVCAPTLKKSRDDVTVHQGLDVVLGAHGEAAQHHGALCPELQTGRALLEQV